MRIAIFGYIQQKNIEERLWMIDRIKVIMEDLPPDGGKARCIPPWTNSVIC